MLEWGHLRVNNISDYHWCIIDSCVTLFQHTEVLLILMVPHSTILICYWFSWYCIPAYYNNTSVCWNKVAWESITHEYGGMRYHENQQYSNTFQHTYWCVIDSHVTSFQHTEVLLILRWFHSSRHISDHLRINNTSVCWNKATRELLTRQ
jgi:capsular polysaccharide biosynthesis protein